MERLAEYAAALADLLSERANVHFRSIEPGSAALVATIVRAAWSRSGMAAARAMRGRRSPTWRDGQRDRRAKRWRVGPTIYSDDADIAKLVDGRFEVIKIASIPLPAKSAQGELRFESVD